MSIMKTSESLLSEKAPQPPGTSRRRFLAETSAAAALAGLAFWGYRRSEPAEAEAASSRSGQPKMVHIVEFSDAGVIQGRTSVAVETQ